MMWNADLFASTLEVYGGTKHSRLVPSDTEIFEDYRVARKPCSESEQK